MDEQLPPPSRRQAEVNTVSAPELSEGLVAVGRFTKPHGLRGDLIFLPYVADFDILPDLIDRSVILKHHTAPTLNRRVLDCFQFHKRVLVRLEGCRDVDQAEALRDYELLIPRHSFPPLPEGEYYWFAIEGLTVYDAVGSNLGVITEIIHTGSNDVYVVRQGEREVLVPALKETVQTIDLSQGEMHLLVHQEWLE